MITATWITALAASIAYGLLLASGVPSHGVAYAYAAVAVAAWVVLAIHHDRRRR